MKDVNYNKLRLDILEKLVCSRMIECKNNRTDMVRKLKLDDEEKYCRPTTVEKVGDNKFLIGIDSNNHHLMVKMGKLIESGESIRSYYSFGRHYYISKINILENELD